MESPFFQRTQLFSQHRSELESKVSIDESILNVVDASVVIDKNLRLSPCAVIVTSKYLHFVSMNWRKRLEWRTYPWEAVFAHNNVGDYVVVGAGDGGGHTAPCKYTINDLPRAECAELAASIAQGRDYRRAE
jgi:hypothetical protein